MSESEKAEKQTDTLSNEVDADVKEEFDIAVRRSDLIQKEALSGALDEAVVEDDSGMPALKPDVVESFEDLNAE